MDRHLDEALSRWVGNGLIDAGGAERIREFEDAASQASAEIPVQTEIPPQNAPQIPIIVETLGYVGGALALAALIAIVATFWGDLTTASRAALCAVVSLVLLLGGLATGRNKAPAAQRLRSALWMFSTGALAGAVVTLVGHGAGASPSDTSVISTFIAAAYAGILWRFSRTFLQETVFYVLLVACVLSVLAEGSSISPVWYSAALWTLGAVWALFAWSRVEPGNAPFVLGAVTMILGLEPAAITNPAVGITWGLVTVALLIAGGVRIKRTSLVVVGALGMLIYVPQACAHWLGGSLGAPLGLLVAGSVILGIAVTKIRARTKS